MFNITINYNVSNQIFLKETYGGSMQNYGTAIKKIRKSRGLTQKSVGQGILSQAAFSKFESGATVIHSTAFFLILERLSMSFEEFEYVSNCYEYPSSKNIIRKFFNSSYNRAEDLETLISEIDEYQGEQPAIDLENIKIICESLLCLNREKDIQKARSLVEPIWLKLSKLDQWYLTDIRLINVILYLFPNDAAIQMADTLLSRIHAYKDFQDSNRLIIVLKINLSLLLIKEQDFTAALTILEDLMSEHKKLMNHQSLSVAFIRIAICRKMLHLGNEDSYLEQARLLLNIYDQQDLLGQVMADYELYTKV